jgi:hypothetical protein
MLFLPLAVGLHLVEDRMWEQPAILLWPLLGGFQVHKAISVNDYVSDLAQGFYPSLSITFISEAAGFVILLAFFALYMKKYLRGG